MKNNIKHKCKYSSINGKFMCAYNKTCRVKEEELDELFDNCPGDKIVVCNNSYPEYIDFIHPSYSLNNKQYDKEEDSPFSSEIGNIKDRIRLIKR